MSDETTYVMLTTAEAGYEDGDIILREDLPDYAFQTALMAHVDIEGEEKTIEVWAIE